MSNKKARKLSYGFDGDKLIITNLENMDTYIFNKHTFELKFIMPKGIDYTSSKKIPEYIQAAVDAIRKEKESAN